MPGSTNPSVRIVVKPVDRPSSAPSTEGSVDLAPRFPLPGLVGDDDSVCLAMAKVAPLNTDADKDSDGPDASNKACTTPLSTASTRRKFSRRTVHNVTIKTSWVHTMRFTVREKMNSIGWYESTTAMSMRRFLRGKAFAVAAVGSLFIALFFPDLFLLLQVPSNIELDVILTLVFAVFSFEFLGLTLTDASYLFSFFFWMDLLGTASMILDISYMSGRDATLPTRVTGASDPSTHLIVVRATRAAKLGARAGRLSRVLKLLRFLPFLFNSDQDEKVRMAKVISVQLTNVISTRVAFLTICMVIVLPTFSIFTYPGTDESMSSWTSLLAESTADFVNGVDAEAEVLSSELTRFSAFYAEMNYGPFRVCYGRDDNDRFVCEDTSAGGSHLDSFTDFSFVEPNRRASVWEVSQDDFAAFFDLSGVERMESAMGVSLIFFIILVMCVFGLILSSNISIIALKPLERMLEMVRMHCQQIFKMTKELEDKDEEDTEKDSKEEEYDDHEQASEFVLLERVVGKLAAIADLTSKSNDPEVREDMDDDDIMVLNWMQGPVTPATATQQRTSSKQLASEKEGGDGKVITPRGVAPSAPHMQIIAGASTIPKKTIDSLKTPSFNSLALNKELQLAVSAYIVLEYEGSCNWVRTNVSEEKLHKFVSSVEAKYLPNKFHNYTHGLDVLYSVARFMTLIDAQGFLSETLQFGILMAAIGHDIGHFAVNNQFLIETGHELSIQYNDMSPLENMHCSKLFQTVSDPEANVFSALDRTDSYKELRKALIDAILHTDITLHNEMVKELSILYQLNSEAFDSQRAPDYLGTGLLDLRVVEVLSDNRHTQLMLNTLLHGADVGNPMKPWDLCHQLAHLCVEEFFAQGDMEKAAGIPVQMLNDREKVNRANSQVGFVEFLIAPMAESMVNLFPVLDDLAENLGLNIVSWSELFCDESTTSEEQATKMRARAQKVASRCQGVLRSNPDRLPSNG